MEYVSREYLLTEYDRQHQGPPGGARKIIAEAPAADVRENKRGKWIYKHDDETGISGKFCSECGKPQGQIYDSFCGNCGADMRKE